MPEKYYKNASTVNATYNQQSQSAQKRFIQTKKAFARVRLSRTIKERETIHQLPGAFDANMV